MVLYSFFFFSFFLSSYLGNLADSTVQNFYARSLEILETSLTFF